MAKNLKVNVKNEDVIRKLLKEHYGSKVDILNIEKNPSALILTVDFIAKGQTHRIQLSKENIENYKIKIGMDYDNSDVLTYTEDFDVKSYVKFIKSGIKRVLDW